jgi:hypothetical protein
MTFVPVDVRLWRHSRKHFLAAGISHFDPTATSSFDVVTAAAKLGCTKPAFIAARIDSTEGLVDCAQQSRVPWWSFTKTALATAALRLSQLS